MTTEKAIQPRGSTAPIEYKQAMYLLKTIWKDAPEQEIVKAAIICRRYNLDPLMKQVFLIKFGTEWVTVLGIKATRKIAQETGHRYSYIDGPRLMTEAEEIAIYGQLDKSKFQAIVKLQDTRGNVYPGYGSWDRAKGVYGADKGNTPQNMAFIRAERNAIDRMAPGELPDIDTAEDSYIVGDFKVALKEGQKIAEQRFDEDVKDLWPQENEGSPPKQAVEPPPPAPQGQTSPPAMESKGIQPEQKKAPPPSSSVFANGLDMEAIRQEFSALNWPDLDVKKHLSMKYHLKVERTVEAMLEKLTREQAEEFIQTLRERGEMK